MTILESISQEWGWTGINPMRILDTNKFGSLIIEDTQGAIWRIIPESLSCVVIAQTIKEYEMLKLENEFMADWLMDNMGVAAESKFGKLPEGKVFHFTLPAILGGEYDIANIDVVPLVEAISLSGSLANQIKDLPDGEKVHLRVVE